MPTSMNDDDDDDDEPTSIILLLFIVFLFIWSLYKCNIYLMFLKMYFQRLHKSRKCKAQTTDIMKSCSFGDKGRSEHSSLVKPARELFSLFFTLCRSIKLSWFMLALVVTESHNCSIKNCMVLTTNKLNYFSSETNLLVCCSKHVNVTCRQYYSTN